MCNSAPKVKPIAAPPEVGAESIDDAAIGERNRERQRQRLRYGRASTILAGDTSAAMSTASVKTALGG